MVTSVFKLHYFILIHSSVRLCLVTELLIMIVYEVIYEIISYVELRIWNQVSYDHRSYERNLSNCV